MLKSNYIQADETTLKVIDVKGNDSKYKKYMWMYKTDGYAGYNKIEKELREKYTNKDDFFESR